MSYLQKVLQLRPLCARYAEIRALVGGVTAIQGASSSYPDRTEALVRNVDLPIFGEHRARSFIDLPGEPSERMYHSARIQCHFPPRLGVEFRRSRQ